jgi:nucleoside triphosphate pyrophosphatase
MYKTKGSLVLASASPRRKDLLNRLGLEYKIIPSGLDEDEEISGPPQNIAMEWARRKAEETESRLRHEEANWYLAVDTIVVINNKVLGKPATRKQAGEYLAMLSGNWHEVISGYCILNEAKNVKLVKYVSSKVKIKELDQLEIGAYIKTDEPMDKAGAYAVQGIGAFMVERIDGSYTNVVGLPLTEVVDDLAKLGVISV